jgi:AAA domain
MIEFKKAERKQVKLKLAITGPSGSGKTFSALKIAQGLAEGKKIALIDTENGSGSLYADHLGMPIYDVMEMNAPFTSMKYLEAIQHAVKMGYEILVIDSITHQWAGEGGILDRLEKEKQAKPGTNSYTMWSRYTPEHEKFKQGYLEAPIHIIATMRSKQDYVMEMNEKGKQAPKKVGLAPVQREGAEYEFTTVFDMSMTHYASVSKDRTGLFKTDHPFIPSESTGQEILKWLLSGKDMAQPKNLDLMEKKVLINELRLELGWQMADVKFQIANISGKENLADMTEEQFNGLKTLMETELKKAKIK